jgi:hypothetical protein
MNGAVVKTLLACDGNSKTALSVKVTATISREKVHLLANDEYSALQAYC